jgi:serine/threonine-protein kinase RsbT
MASLEESIRLFAPGESSNLIARCKSTLGLEAGIGPGGAFTPQAAKSLVITTEQDIAAARSEAWSEALRIGLTKFASVKVATVVSELARNIVFYAGKGTVELKVEEREKHLCLLVVATDQGPGIEPEKLRQILSGTYQSDRGLGRGLIAVKKLAEDFHLDTAPGMGTTVRCMFKGA